MLEQSVLHPLVLLCSYLCRIHLGLLFRYTFARSYVSSGAPFGASGYIAYDACFRLLCCCLYWVCWVSWFSHVQPMKKRKRKDVDNRNQYWLHWASLAPRRYRTEMSCIEYSWFWWFWIEGVCCWCAFWIPNCLSLLEQICIDNIG